jgi:hypothetical protein
MKLRHITRLAAVALAGVGLATTVAGVRADAVIVDNDNVEIQDQGIDFGGSVFAFGAPAGAGNLAWDVGGSGVRPILTGTLHLDNVSQEWGRMHIEYFDANGNHLQYAHSTSRFAPSNRHYSFAVNLQPPAHPNLVEVEICTELGPTSTGPFTRIGCQTEFLN